jgi:hypothetical protein
MQNRRRNDKSARRTDIVLMHISDAYCSPQFHVHVEPWDVVIADSFTTGAGTEFRDFMKETMVED